MKMVTKTRNWFITINQNAECFPFVLDLIKSIEKLQYSVIYHDKENEEQPHYHAFLCFENARTFQTIQNKFQGAHIEIVSSKYLTSRYLLHLDNPEKYQYSLNDLITNCNQVEYYSNHNEYDKLDTESLLSAISDGVVFDTFSAIKKFGLKQVNLYRNTIKEVIQELRLDKDIDKAFELGRSEGFEDGYQNGCNDRIQLVEEIEFLKETINIYKYKYDRANKIIEEYEQNHKLFL